MRINNKQDEIVFLMGAGTSIPIGIPAMRGIYKAYMDKKVSRITEQDKKTCQMFINEMGVDEDLEEFLLASNAILEFKDSSIYKFIEKSISRVKNTKSIKTFNERLSSNITDVESVKDGIINFLAEMCFSFDRPNAVKINKGFVNIVSSIGYPVYTTNYDFAFEYVTEEAGIPLHDNFVVRKRRHIWNTDIDFNKDKGLRLIKLHGSVTWYSDDNGVIEKIDTNTNINKLGKKVGRTVITPTRFKDIYDQHYFALYSHFLSSLIKASTIVIAGHSLRDEYLRAAIIERKRKGNFKVIVINPKYPSDLKDEMPAVRIGTIGDVIHIPYKWEEFADELSYILKSSSNDNIVKDCINIIKTKKYAKNRIKIKGNLGILLISQKKKLSVDVSAYLTANERPAKLRVWLEHTVTDSTGNKLKKVSGEFLEDGDIILGSGLTGLIKSTKNISFKIPMYENWLKEGSKVLLHAGIVKGHVKKPRSTTSGNIIASDTKSLSYRLK